MSFLKNLWARIRAIKPRQWAFGGIVLVVGFAALMGVLYAWDYTNSSAFCGTTCHTMPPEYNAWQRSPHARVNCVECHIGRDFIATSFTRKAGDLKHVITLSSGNYKFPLYAEQMLPARDACEKCHWPEKFAQDRATVIKHYGTDEKNTLITTFLLLRVGGGTERQGQGFGIHWHIENKIEFIAQDELKQNIPWIQVTDANGTKTVYQDIENPLTPAQIANDTKHQMDCIDCHNRISHTFFTPDQAIDQGLALKRIDPSIPGIKKKGTELMSASYKGFEDANKVIDSLDGFYSQNYPDYYKGNTAKVKAAVDYLKTLYQSLVFPGQELSWTTHPDNIGHKDSAGCFRCHDGKHFTADNSKAIRLECNVCHTIPEVSTPGGPVPSISLATVSEPDSHKTTTWLYEHRSAYNTTCQACHDTNNAGGKDNSSFCSNSACHGSNWKFVGLNAPALAKVFQVPVLPAANPSSGPKAIPHPIGGNPDCQVCHGKGKVRPYPADHVGRSNDICLACHKPTVQPTATPGATKTPGAVVGPPSIPHDTAGRTQCLGCHGNGASGVPQIPQFHKDYGFTNANCVTCHKSSVSAPTPTKGSSASSSSASSAGGPPRVPASHAGRTGCLMCHVQGIGGAPKYPTNHAGRTEDTCKMCHQGP